MGYGWLINKEEKFELKTHGNASITNQPYIRASESTLSWVKKKSFHIGNAQFKFNENVKISSIPLSDNARNTKQYFNHKYIQLKNKDKNLRSGDEYYDALRNRLKSNYKNFYKDLLYPFFNLMHIA